MGYNSFMAKDHRPDKKYSREVVTGDFELHFEDIVKKSRYSIMILLTGGLLLAAFMVPGIVNRSLADEGSVSIEAEQGRIINLEKVRLVETGSGEGYIEFVQTEAR